MICIISEKAVFKIDIFHWFIFFHTSEMRMYLQSIVHPHFRGVGKKKLLPAHLAWAAATGALGVTERSYPTSEIRGRSRGDPTPEGGQPRGVTPCPRSGAAAESARRSYSTPPCPRPGAARAQEGLEELSHVEGQEGRR